MSLRILIIAENPLARMGLAGLLSAHDDYEVVGQLSVNNLDLLENYAPDVLLWDFGWEPDLERIGEIVQEEIPIIALINDEIDVAAVWSAEIAGLLPQDVDAEQLGAALNAVDLGLMVIDPAFAGALRSSDPLPPESSSIDDTLTPRENEVLQLVAQGLTNKAIAQQLSISEHTVKFHINAIMTKLGAQSRTDAVVRASQKGLIVL